MLLVLALLLVMWGILSKFGCPPQLLAVLREFHDGMTAKVVVGCHESDPFMVNIGVKQGCVMAPVIFNLFLVAVTLVFRSGILTEDGIGLQHHLRPKGRHSSSSSTQRHKRSCNRSSLQHLWQSLCIRFWIKESPSVPSTVAD